MSFLAIGGNSMLVGYACPCHTTMGPLKILNNVHGIRPEDTTDAPFLKTLILK